MSKKTQELTDTAQLENPETRKKVRNFAVAAILVAGVGLLINDQVKKFTERKQNGSSSDTQDA